MITEYEAEPIPGLPGLPPKGERILWQGSPDWRVLARNAFHIRVIGGYFALLTAVAAIEGVRIGSATGVLVTGTLGVAVVALLVGLAWLSARTSIYTLTNRRIVLRIGMALPKCVNLPLGLVGSVGLRRFADGSGDLPITLTARQALGYLMLWPHARPWHLNNPQPMLRAVPDVDRVAALVSRACRDVQPDGVITPVAAPDAAAEPAFGAAVPA